MPAIQHMPPELAATAKQINYLLILFNDLEFSFESRNAWLRAEFLRKTIAGVSDLSKQEASIAIEKLKAMKE